jgi:hypothetical protein
MSHGGCRHYRSHIDHTDHNSGWPTLSQFHRERVGYRALRRASSDSPGVATAATSTTPTTTPGGLPFHSLIVKGWGIAR